jgi:uncharacterized protein YndB with AHSA1/START domain
VIPADQPNDTVVVRRLLPVPRERVFAAWVDPASLARWMLPGRTTRTIVETELRVGGKFRIVMRRATEDFEAWGEYLAIEPPSLLSFTWIAVNTDLQPSVVTVELFERDTGTELVLTHRRLPPRMIESYSEGWTDIVEKLELVLTTGGHSRASTAT